MFTTDGVVKMHTKKVQSSWFDSGWDLIKGKIIINYIIIIIWLYTCYSLYNKWLICEAVSYKYFK